MIGVSLFIGGLAFVIGLILIGLSGSRRFASTWVGPLGALLLMAGLGLQVLNLGSA